MRKADNRHLFERPYEVNFGHKRCSMGEKLMLRKFEESSVKILAPVIPIQLVNHKRDNPEDKNAKEKVKDRLPLFYTAPIFKSKEHDFL